MEGDGEGAEVSVLIRGHASPENGQNVMVWGAIVISHNAGPLIVQNIGPGRGNGVTDPRYINQVLRLHIVPYFVG